MNKARISVVVPSYNQGTFIEETLLSVLNQKYGNTELIVIDGGSTDNSVEVIKKYEADLAFWCSEKDDGQSDAINKGFKHATGDIFCWLNSDDMFESGAFDFVAGEMEGKAVSWMAGAARAVNINGRSGRLREPGEISLSTFLQYKNYWFSQPSVFWTRDIWHEVGGINPKFNYIMDLDFFYRLYCVARPHTTNRVLSVYRVHAEAKTSKDGPKVDLEYACWLKDLVERGHKDADVLFEVLQKYVYLQRCYRTMSDHVVISRVINFWRKYVNRNIYT